MKTMPKHLRSLVVVNLFGVLFANLAHAGLFSTALSDEDAKSLKRIGIASSLGHKLRGQQVGLTVIGNRHFEVDLPDWTLDADVRMQWIEGITTSGRHTATLEPWEDAPTGNHKATLAAAREKGFDAVLVIEATDNPNDRLLPEGPSLLHKKALGLDRVHPCNSMRADMYRVAVGKRIGFATPDACDYAKSFPPVQAWHENWTDYSDDDKRLVLDGVTAHVRKQIYMILTRLNLQRQ
jgi:hypothetical protein